jgi:hypothetical protein
MNGKSNVKKYYDYMLFAIWQCKAKLS